MDDPSADAATLSALEMITAATGEIKRMPLGSSPSCASRALRCLTVASGAQTGIVTLIQRFGSALDLNVHLHLLALDGAYSFERKRPIERPGGGVAEALPAGH